MDDLPRRSALHHRGSVVAGTADGVSGHQPLAAQAVHPIVVPPITQRTDIEKTWVEPEDFVPALKFALEHFHCRKIDWGKTLAALQADAYKELVIEEAKRRLKLDTSLGLSGEAGVLLSLEVNRETFCLAST